MFYFKKVCNWHNGCNLNTRNVTQLFVGHITQKQTLEINRPKEELVYDAQVCRPRQSTKTLLQNAILCSI